MQGNFFECKNEVFIEDISIGQFETIEIEQSRDIFGDLCTITIPLYSIGIEPGLSTPDRLRQVLEGIQIKPGAKIEIYTWYNDSPFNGFVYPKILQFSGFIAQVISGFPTTIKCQDNSYILRFGTIGRDWPAKQPLRDMIEYLLPISNEAFKEYRRNNNFDRPDNFQPLSFDETNSSSLRFTMKAWRNISPYEALTKLMKMFTLYGKVFNNGLVYFGLGVTDRINNQIDLSTDRNVIERNIIPQNGLFTSYKVVINGLLADGTKYSYEAGDEEGEVERVPTVLSTPEGIKRFGDSVLQRLKGDRNSGEIKTILYPHCQLFDVCNYNDTLFQELSGVYYVIGRLFRGSSDEGYIQTLRATNEIFML